MFSLVGAYYYLRVVKVMYFDEPVQTAPVERSQGRGRAARRQRRWRC